MNAKIRTFHRWTSIVFTATVVLAFIGSVVPEPIAFLYYLPLLPLALLMITGLTMFVKHVRGRGRRVVAE